MNLNLKVKVEQTYDAIVVGSGISGGWAVKELTEKGLKVLLLERGKPLEHVVDYKGIDPWGFPHHGRLSNETRAKFPIQSKEGNYPITEANQQLWMPESLNPYLQEKPFDWYRGNQIGGKSLTWGRHTYRLSDLDFEANAKEGIGIDWPIRYKDIAPWYAYVERFVGISGEALGLDHIPDSIFQPAMPLNCVEDAFKKGVKAKYQDSRYVTPGRVAHLTKPTAEQTALGRASCQYRNACSNGCPYGAYFSTQAATLPAAKKTNNLSILANALVSRVIFDEKLNKATGVEVIDAETKERQEYYAKIIFITASTIGTTQILLNSTSNRFPNGLGNDSGVLGKNLMDHHSRVGANAEVEGFEDQYYFGRKPNGIFIPRYRNIGNDRRDYLRGFDYQGGAGRGGWEADSKKDGFGADFKESLLSPGKWSIGMSAFGEFLPDERNQVRLHPTEKDPNGLPMLVFEAELRENEFKMRKDMANDAAEMLEAAGFKNVKSFERVVSLGLSKHEMGTARMGLEPKTSVLNKHNQVWGCENVFVTDGSSMVSSSCVNPSLTYMALTARACDFAVKKFG